MNIGILLFEKWHGKKFLGSSRIRGHWLVKHWDELELFEQGKKYDAVIFQKTYWLKYVESYDGIKILDVCDPDWLDGQAEMRNIINHCDAVTTSTEALRDTIKGFAGDKPVVYIPDRQDLEFHNKQKVHKGRAKKIIWFGYSHNASVLDIALGFLKSKDLQLTILSEARPPYPNADRNIKYDWGNPEFDFNGILLQHDIVLLPEDTRPRGKYKSKNKTYTAWALGLPVASTPEDVERFMEAEERRKEAKLRLKEIREKYDVKQSVEDFKQLIKQIDESRRKNNTN